MSEWPYVIGAYSLTWVVLAGFAIYLGARDAKVRGGEP
jgi:hypothetical protein